MTLFLLLSCTATAPVAPSTEGVAAVPSEAPAEAPAAPEAATNSNTLTVGAGVKVTPVFHGTVRIEHEGTTIWIDPWSKASMPSPAPADLVLLTDIHQDHLDPAALQKVVGSNTQVVAPAAVQEALAKESSNVAVQHVLANGESAEVAGIGITAVPMYNHTRGPKPGTLYHDKGRGNGYLLTVGGAQIYIAGDTACTDDMKALKNVDLALIPMNLPYTMTPEEAAECVAAFKPKAVTPYHYGSSDLTVFTAALEGVEGVRITLVDAYPGGLPF